VQRGRARATQRQALLRRGDDLRWPRRQRDRIAAEVLRAEGASASAAAAAAADVPLFLPVDS
jgi:hypothetical protein